MKISIASFHRKPIFMQWTETLVRTAHTRFVNEFKWMVADGITILKTCLKFEFRIILRKFIQNLKTQCYFSQSVMTRQKFSAPSASQNLNLNLIFFLFFIHLIHRHTLHIGGSTIMTSTSRYIVVRVFKKDTHTLHIMHGKKLACIS